MGTSINDSKGNGSRSAGENLPVAPGTGSEPRAPGRVADPSGGSAPTVARNRTQLKGRRVLVVDDELAIRRALQVRFGDEGALTDAAEDVAAAKRKLAEKTYDLIVLDHRLPDGTGMALLQESMSSGFPGEIVMMTAYSSTEDAVRAMKIGAADYVMKPFDLDEMVLVCERALEQRRLRTEVKRLQSREAAGARVSELVGRSAAMSELRGLVERVAGSGARNILLRGESGTGKELVARAIHFASPEADRPFMNITCTALPETLLESELFGHERGAFTDAKTGKAGLFEQAEGGTIFLDEIGDMPMSLQAKLLRFLESKQFRRVGGLADISIDVRIVAATNANLEEAIQAGRFRRDLFYRLNVIPIDIPPLRERPEDIPDLVDLFASRFAAELKRPVRRFSDRAMELMRRHDWPGNVRELRNAVERAVLLGTGAELSDHDLPALLRAPKSPRPEPTMSEPASSAEPKPAATPEPAPAQAPVALAHPFTLPGDGVVLDDVLKDLLDQALERSAGNKSRAANLLGIHRDQVRYWVKKYELTRWIRTRTSASGDAGDDAES